MLRHGALSLEGRTIQLSQKLANLGLITMGIAGILYFPLIRDHYGIGESAFHLLMIVLPLILFNYLVIYIMSRPLAEELDISYFLLDLEKQKADEEREKALIAQDKAEEAQEESEKLLLNILPFKVAQELKSKGYKAIGVLGNISLEADAQTLVDTAKKEFGSVDIVVNNAGITKDTLLMRMKKEQWDAVIAVNLTGTYLVTQAAIKVMMKQDNGGSIINLSSISGENGNIGQTNYSASKAGVIGFTKAVALEMASRKVRCNAIAPGFIATEMTEAIPENIKAGMVAAIPLKRAGLPEDIANGIAFLASDAASFITGHVLDINGGGFLPGGGH